MMHKALPPKRNVSRLYIPRKEGGRGLLSVEDIINLAVIGLERYVNNSEERLLSAGKRIWRQSNEYGGESESEFKTRKINERKQSWKEKCYKDSSCMGQTDEEAGTER